MESKKQSSIEWLMNEIINQMGMRIENTIIGKQLVEKAKELHKQEIIDAYHINPLQSKWENIGEKYYNEQFKKK